MGGRGASSATAANSVGDLAEAVEHYASGEGMYVNQLIRRGEYDSLSNEEKRFAQDLDRATQSSNIDVSKLYRSVDASSVFGDMSQLQYEQLTDAIVYNDDFARESVQAIIENALPGKTITEKGFMSTSESYDVVSGWYDFTGSDKPITLELSVLEGTRGAKVYELTPDAEARDPQREVLLPRNTRYKIRSVSSRDGLIYVKADIV